MPRNEQVTDKAMRSEQEVCRAVDLYADTVRRLCMLYLKNYADTEDVLQTVFIKYMLSSAQFESPDHEKAWVIRVAVNACKDLLRSFFRRFTVPLDALQNTLPESEGKHGEVLDAVLSLPQKYKEVVYLHYYEGYSAPEISIILKKNVNTVYTLLARSKQLLKDKLGDEHVG